jgi:hypothetical protein
VPLASQSALDRAKVKAKLVLRQEQIRILETQLRHIVGEFDTEVANTCPLTRPLAASQDDADCGNG